ncbi:MAG: homoserine kinase [Thermodesulfobacteriota bacterium]
MDFLDKSELAEIAEEYALGRVGSVTPAPDAWSRRGNHQTNLLLDTTRGKVIVRFDEVKGELDVKREVDLLLYLRKHGFPCPQPLADRKGRHYRDAHGACLIVYKHIDGRRPRIDTLSAAQIENIGRSLADLHVVGKGYKKGIDNRFSFERIADLYNEVRGHLPSYFKKITRTLDEEVEYLGSYLEGKLPKGVINGDLFDENLLVKGDKLVGMLDFEAACRGKFIFDLATAVNAVCFTDGKYDLKRFESLITGYESVRTLSLAEWDAFPNELRFSALRFTVTRLREVLALPDAELGLAAITEERGSAARAEDRSSCGAEERGRVARAFQDFFDRLSILRREREGGMEPMLLAMATGYDYRKYQKVKAVEKKGSK